MSTLKVFYEFMKAIPELLALVRQIQEKADELEKERKVKESVKAINEAFKRKDAALLRKVFNNS